MRAAAAPFITAGLLLAGGGLLVLWVRGQGGASSAGAALGAAAVDAAGGVVSGAVGEVSRAVGLPGPSETTQDPQVARWIIDHFGVVTASRWAGVPALVRGLAMAAGQGVAPPAGTAAHAALVKSAAARTYQTGSQARAEWTDDVDASSIDAGIDWRLFGN